MLLLVRSTVQTKAPPFPIYKALLNTVRPRGLPTLALVAASPLQVYPHTPVPAIVVIVPDLMILRMRLLLPSATIKFPAGSIASPLGAQTIAFVDLILSPL